MFICASIKIIGYMHLYDWYFMYFKSRIIYFNVYIYRDPCQNQTRCTNCKLRVRISFKLSKKNIFLGLKGNFLNIFLLQRTFLTQAKWILKLVNITKCHRIFVYQNFNLSISQIVVINFYVLYIIWLLFNHFHNHLKNSWSYIVLYKSSVEVGLNR